MPGYYNLKIWAGNNLPVVPFEFPFDLDGLVAVFSIIVPSRGIRHDFSSTNPDSGVTIRESVDEDGNVVDPPDEKRTVEWRYTVEFSRSLPRHELIEYELELRDDDGGQRTFVAGNVTILGGANADT
ncbi:hypothetical protein ACUSIJ_25140 [Pseudochelatococcus sp. B33]